MAVKFAKNVTPVKAGHGVWVKVNENGVIVDVIKNNGDNPNTGDYDDYAPFYNESRVTGDRYLPYEQATDWAYEANARMRLTANDHFRNSR